MVWKPTPHFGPIGLVFWHLDKRSFRGQLKRFSSYAVNPLQRAIMRLKTFLGKGLAPKIMMEFRGFLAKIGIGSAAAREPCGTPKPRGHKNKETG